MNFPVVAIIDIGYDGEKQAVHICENYDDVDYIHEWFGKKYTTFRPANIFEFIALNRPPSVSEENESE